MALSVIIVLFATGSKYLVREMADIWFLISSSVQSGFITGTVGATVLLIVSVVVKKLFAVDRLKLYEYGKRGNLFFRISCFLIVSGFKLNFVLFFFFGFTLGITGVFQLINYMFPYVIMAELPR